MTPRSVLLAAALLAWAASSSLAAQEATPPAPQPGAPAAAKPGRPADIYDTAADAPQQVAAALARAKRDNCRVLLQWGANWCGWCHLLHDLCAKDKDIAHELSYEYDVVLVDIGKSDKNMELAASYGADLQAHGVPYLTVLDADGKVLANQETGELEAKQDGQQGHDPAKVLAFLRQHKADYLQAEDVQRAALAQAARDGRRVFLHFGAPWCTWCHKLDEWMAREPAASLLARDFVDCKIDVDRTLGGKELLARLHDGAQDGGIPWFVFLAADGSVLATSDGTQGNIGFPAQPHEIAHFRAMLQKAAVKLDTAALDTLVESLRPAPAPAAGAGSGPRP